MDHVDQSAGHAFGGFGESHQTVDGFGEIGRPARPVAHLPGDIAGVDGPAGDHPAQIVDEGYRYRYAWPSGDWGSLPVEGGIEAAYKADLAASDDPDALRVDIEARLNRLRSPFRSAEAYGVEDIIDPRETRQKLVEFVRLTEKLRKLGPSSFWMRP